jgi:hypothetical protein
MWEPRRLTALLASTACYRDSFTFALHADRQMDGETGRRMFCSFSADEPHSSGPVVRRPEQSHREIVLYNPHPIALCSQNYVRVLQAALTDTAALQRLPAPV